MYSWGIMKERREVQMGSEAYTEILNSIRRRKAGNSIASEVNAMGIRMKEYQMAWDAVAACADIREDLTAPIKARLKEGTYQVSAEDFAEKLLRK